MCGFVSTINLNSNFNLNLLKNRNFHRGPDNIKILNNKNFSILFRRLSIIDISSKADQPFESLDKKKILIFNGEIYNYLELRNILKKKYKFLTTSDTEVIMKSYEEWGINFVKKLRGMFSIVLFDKRLNKIFFIRDPMGQKPLYYAFAKEGLIVSSEIKDILFILKKMKLPIKEEKNVLKKFLIRGWADDENSTFFKNIYKFPAGTFTIYKNKKLLKPKTYWRLDLNKKKKFNSKIFLKKLKENIKIHLRSDVPIAFTLSGGIDSSSIVKISKKYIKKLTAFSLISSYSDETAPIKRFLKQNKIRHFFFNSEKMYQKNSLKDLIKCQDEPFISPSHFDQFLLRKKIKSKGFKVIVVGEGADEILSGYFRQAIVYFSSIYNKKNILKDNIYQNLRKFFVKDEDEIRNKVSYFMNLKKSGNDMEDLVTLEFLKEKKLNKKLRFKNSNLFGTSNIVKKNLIQHSFERDLPYTIRAEDRISMANSIENRSPFIDHKFVEYVFSHDPKYFVNNGIPKFMLRKAMIGCLPNYYIQGVKKPRPGSDVKIIKFYSKEFNSLLKKHNVPFFNKKKIIKKFNSDSKDENFNNSSFFYFRILIYLIWKDVYFKRLSN